MARTSRPSKQMHPLHRFVISTALAGVSIVLLWVAITEVLSAARMSPLPPVPLTATQALVLLAVAEVLVLTAWYLGSWVMRSSWHLLAEVMRAGWRGAHARTPVRARPEQPAEQPARIASLAARVRAHLPTRQEGPWAAAEAHARAEAPPPTDPTDPVALRIAEGLTGLIFGDARAETPLSVVRVHPVTIPGAHRQVEITYPPRVAARIHEAQAAITVAMARNFPPFGDEWKALPNPKEDRLTLIDRADPLAPAVPLQPVDADPDLFAGIPMARREDGTWWRMPLMGGFHWFVVGSSGAGKGSWLGGVVATLEPMIADGRVRLWIADPKGGAEFSWAKRFAHAFAISAPDIADMLEAAVAEMQRKNNALGDSEDFEAAITVPTRETPLDLVIIDELAHVVAYGSDAQLIKRSESALNTLLSQGRAPATTVLAAAQDPRKKVTDMRELFTGTVLLRVKKAADVNTILGAGARADGAYADLIPEHLKGVAFVMADGQSTWERVRTPGLFGDRRRALSARIGAALRARAGEPLDLVAEEPAREPVAAGSARARASVDAQATDQRKSLTRAARGASDGPVRVDALTPGARVHLEVGDEQVAVVVDVVRDEEDEDRWVLSWHPEGSPRATRFLNLDGGERVTLAH